MSDCLKCYGQVISQSPSPSPTADCICAPHIYVPAADSVVECGIAAVTPFPEDSVDVTLCDSETVTYHIESYTGVSNVSIDETGVFYTSVAGGDGKFEINFSIRCGMYGAYGSVTGRFKDMCSNAPECDEGQVCNPCTGLCEENPDLEIGPSTGPDLEITV